MKVLLVQSYLGGKEPLVFPLGLSLIAATLGDHEVKVCDTNTFADPFAELEKVTRDFSPDVVGISLRNIDSTNKRKVVFYYKYLRQTITVIRDCSRAKIIVGGSGFSMFAREIMQNEAHIDFGVYLEGEPVFHALLANLDSPETVPSVFFRRNGKVRFSGPRDLIDVKTLPIPERRLFAIDAYKDHRDAFGVETKRGCGLSCIYCIYGFLNGKGYRLKDPGRIVDEIEGMVHEHELKRFTFVDSMFNVPCEHAEKICRELIRRKLSINWSAWFHERFLSRDFLDLIKEAGCDHIILSPDGFSDSVLQRLGKNISNHDILDCYKNFLSKDGFEVSYNFFKNPPGQTMANFLGILFFYLRAKLRLQNRVHFEFSALRVEPHTGLYDIALVENEITREDSLLYPKYYRNRKTWYIEKIFNLILSLKGL